jgi:hypothetical protein
LIKFEEEGDILEWMNQYRLKALRLLQDKNKSQEVAMTALYNWKE